MITGLALVLVGTALANNVVLLQFLGIGPVLGFPNRTGPALALCAISSGVLITCSVIGYLLLRLVLEPLGLAHLRTLVFMLLIATVVQLLDLYLRSTRALLRRALGDFLALVCVNCAVLGVLLLGVQPGVGFLHALFQAIGACAGFTLVMLLFQTLRERIDTADVPLPFRGAAIGLVTAGLMSLAFMGFAGLD